MFVRTNTTFAGGCLKWPFRGLIRPFWIAVLTRRVWLKQCPSLAAAAAVEGRTESAWWSKDELSDRGLRRPSRSRRYWRRSHNWDEVTAHSSAIHTLHILFRDGRDNCNTIVDSERNGGSSPSNSFCPVFLFGYAQGTMANDIVLFPAYYTCIVIKCKIHFKLLRPEHTWYPSPVAAMASIGSYPATPSSSDSTAPVNLSPTHDPTDSSQLQV